MKIIYVGTLGFPYGTAPVKKQELISKTLINGGNEVLILSRFGIHNSKLNRKGKINGINYLYTSIFGYKLKNKVLNQLNKIIGVINEYLVLLIKDYDIIISNNRSFQKTYFYTQIAHLRGKKIILTFVEDNDIVPQSNSFFGKIDSKLFSKYTWKIVDGVLPISEYLVQKVKKCNSTIPIFKLPVLVDYNAFDKIPSNGLDNSFVFCGSLAYFDVIKFILLAYKKANTEAHLTLIVNGNKSQKKKLEQYLLNNSLSLKVCVKIQLTDDELIQNYKSATALLIPLRNTIQDVARFPHKIGEYCASRRPIISSDIGEIKHYFKNMESALLMDSYNIDELANHLSFIENNTELAKKMGNNSYKIGLMEFNYKNYINPMCDFLKSI